MKTRLLFLCTCYFAVVNAADYTLVWNQDFTGNDLDTRAWNIEVNDKGGGNNELQYYCEKAVTQGVEPTTGKHCLILTATKEDYLTRKCTSGRVNSLGKTYFTYGKIEARIKLPKTANGLWPAFWMMGNNYPTVGWPKCGETDIMEMGNSGGYNGNKQEHYFNGAMHVGAAWNSDWCDAQSATWPYSLQDTFHIFTCEWTPDSIKMYVDKDAHPENKPYFKTPLEYNKDDNYNRQLVWSKPSFIIFNLAIGGNFPNIFDIKNVTALSNSSAAMYVDWVRVYQKGDVGQTFHSDVASDPIENQLTSLSDQTLDGKSDYRKLMIGSHLYILHDGVYYDLLGHVVK